MKNKILATAIAVSLGSPLSASNSGELLQVGSDESAGKTELIDNAGQIVDSQKDNSVAQYEAVLNSENIEIGHVKAEIEKLKTSDWFFESDANVLLGHGSVSMMLSQIQKTENIESLSTEFENFYINHQILFNQLEASPSILAIMSRIEKVSPEGQEELGRSLKNLLIHNQKDMLTSWKEYAFAGVLLFLSLMVSAGIWKQCKSGKK